ncbi:MAG: hypothetical protein QOI71_2547, partial [Gaiellales bacterium]|nr:hypothetical protein [Gaiellales bacterium]
MGATDTLRRMEGSSGLRLTGRRLSALGALLSALLVMGVVSAVARSDGRQSAAAVVVPLRAIVYATAPAKVIPGRPAAIRVDSGAPVQSHLAALAWAGADAAIVRWNGRGTVSDRNLGALLAAIASSSTHVRAAALIDGGRGDVRTLLGALARLRGAARGYLRVGTRPAVFVGGEGSYRSCGPARRLRAAARGLWLAQGAFAGYERCLAAADVWFRDRPVTRTARARGSFLIRPGYWAPNDRTPRVPRSLAAWRRSIAQMVASRAPLQIIDSLNDWTQGSAVEASGAWPSTSGYGAYLDALHVTRTPPSAPVAPPALGPPVPPTLSAAVVSNVLAHQATVSSSASSGTASTTLWVEFTATTTGEVQTTVPTTMAAGSPQHPVSIDLPGLSAAVQYRAHVVASSSVGRISSPDVLFTTLTDAQVTRVAAAGDIACDPAGSLFMGGAGTLAACHQVATSNAILAGSYDAVLTLGDQQYNSGTASQFAGSYQPSWGRFVAITHPVVGNHEYGSPGAAAYFQYFGAAAGEPGKGYYSFDVGPWHMIALNS